MIIKICLNLIITFLLNNHTIFIWPFANIFEQVLDQHLLVADYNINVSIVHYQKLYIMWNGMAITEHKTFPNNKIVMMITTHIISKPIFIKNNLKLECFREEFEHYPSFMQEAFVRIVAINVQQPLMNGTVHWEM